MVYTEGFWVNFKHNTISGLGLFLKKSYLFTAALALWCAWAFLQLWAARATLSLHAQAAGGAALCCGARALGRACFSSCGSWALGRRLSHCGSRVQLLFVIWELAESGIEPVSLALAGGFFTTEPPGKSLADKSCRLNQADRIALFYFSIIFFFKGY